jgi:hypothetical protein
MKRGPALPCFRCGRTFDSTSWIDANNCRCLHCREDFEFLPFPALVKTRAIAKPQAIAVADDSSCFFHAENQAEKVCDGCGRFLCNVCAIPFSGRIVCSSCVAAKKTGDTPLLTERALHDGIALSLALLPILFWPLTLLSAPTALGVAIYGWNKPRSLVRSGRSKLVLAMLLALLQIGGWIFLGVQLALR